MPFFTKKLDIYLGLYRMHYKLYMHRCILYINLQISTTYLSLQMVLFFPEPFEDSCEDHSLFYAIKEDAHFPNNK